MTRDIFPDEAELADALAQRLCNAIHQRPAIVLGLPTGRTPLALYQQLRERTRKHGLDWSRVRTFNLDEFVGLGRGDAGSYRSFMEERLFAHVGITPANVGFLDGRATDLIAECARYDRALLDAGGIDVLLLGIGENGHIGFNEPSDGLVALTHRVRLSEPTRAANTLWFGGDPRLVPHEALTMGMASILGARTIVLMATGEGKAEAVHAMVEGRVTPSLPASFLQLHPRVTVMLDEPAASELSTRR